MCRAAHISFAVQTPAPVLGLSHASPYCRRIHNELLALGARDLEDAYWKDAVRLQVFDGSGPPPPPMPTEKLEYDEAAMVALPYKKIVLVDVSSGRPLVLYDARGGLGHEEACAASDHFAFLENFDFKLARMLESHSSGALGLDGVGAQRMVMLGVRSQGRNMKSRPTRSRPWLCVGNSKGDLDAYVASFDDERLCGTHVGKVWEDLATRMRILLPRACAELSRCVSDSCVRERLFSQAAQDLLTADGVVLNVGVSSAYQSPAHVDRNDTGWTFAFACKCCHSRRRRVPRDTGFWGYWIS